jgi:hypothetical protein
MAGDCVIGKMPGDSNGGNALVRRAWLSGRGCFRLKWMGDGSSQSLSIAQTYSRRLVGRQIIDAEFQTERTREQIADRAGRSSDSLVRVRFVWPELIVRR